MQTLDWVTRFLWYLARAARRKFCFGNPRARSAEKNFATVDRVTRFLWLLARAARRKFCFCKTGARSAEKKFATLDWVTCFLWYLARGARRKFCICNSGAHRAEKNFCNAGLGHPFSLASDARSGEKILQRWSRSPVRSDWVTRFLWYLARAARRKSCPSYNRSPVFSGIWRAQRGENFAFATLARAARRKILQAMNLQKTQW